MARKKKAGAEVWRRGVPKYFRDNFFFIRLLYKCLWTVLTLKLATEIFISVFPKDVVITCKLPSYALFVVEGILFFVLFWVFFFCFVLFCFVLFCFCFCFCFVFVLFFVFCFVFLFCFVEGPGRIPSLKSDQSFFVSQNLAIKTVYWKVTCQ